MNNKNSCKYVSKKDMASTTFAHNQELIPKNHDDDQGDSGVQTLSRPKAKTKEPAMYKVILLNDDFTPMDFVIEILVQFFNKSDIEANQLMLEVHSKGSAVAAVYGHEVAETKVYLVNDHARRNKFPLKCIMEKD